MRLIELTDLYPPTIGGLERFVALLSEGLASRGHEVHVVTSAVPGAPAAETCAGVTVHRIPLLYQRLAPRLSQDAARPFHPPAPDPLFRRLLAEVVQEVNPDVIHAHAWSVFSCLTRAFPRTPVMVTAHDYSLACARKSLVHRSGASCPGPSWRRCGPCASSMYGPAKGKCPGGRVPVQSPPAQEGGYVHRGGERLSGRVGCRPSSARLLKPAGPYLAFLRARWPLRERLAGAAAGVPARRRRLPPLCRATIPIQGRRCPHRCLSAAPIPPPLVMGLGTAAPDISGS